MRARALIAAVGAVLLLIMGGTPAAGASTGLTNMGFETGDLTGWTASSGQAGGVQVITGDEFTGPYEGSYLVRLGHPSNLQSPGVPNSITQEFVVDSPEEAFVWNVFTYDYTGFDRFEFAVTVVDPATGEVIVSFQQGAFGSGTALKSTGWRYAKLDLADHVGDTVRLYINAMGTADTLYNFWAYADSAESGPPPQVVSEIEQSSDTGSSYTDPQTGLVTVAMPQGAKSDLTVSTVVECPDGSSPTSVTLYLENSGYPMSLVAGTASTYTVTIPAAQLVSGTLKTIVQCNSGEVSTIVGSVALYDPSGIVSDAVTGDPVVGAHVTLFSVPGTTAETTADTDDSTCQSNATKPGPAGWNQPVPAVYSSAAVEFNPFDPADPTLPKLNPFVTNDIGYYGWFVPAGCYFVSVTADGYESLVSPWVGVLDGATAASLGVQPDVTDLDLQLTPVSQQPDDCTLAYSGSLDVAAGTTPKLTATITDSDPSDGSLAGHLVTFQVDKITYKTTLVNGKFKTVPVYTPVASPTASTDAAGVAQAEQALTKGWYRVTASFGGDAELNPCAASAVRLLRR